MDNQYHRNNLHTALDILKGLDIEEANFNMRHWYSDPVTTRQQELFIAENAEKCNTAACACGWIVLKAVGHLIPTRKEKTNHQFDWVAYITRVFGMPVIGADSVSFLFLFDSAWSRYDNTLKGVIKRIELFIRNDYKPPSDFIHDVFNKEGIIPALERYKEGWWKNFELRLIKNNDKKITRSKECVEKRLKAL